MVRVAAVALALAGLTVLAAGVIEAVPLVFWGTAEEHASADHGRTVMLIGAALTLVAAAGARSVLLAVAAVLPTVLVLATPGTAFGLLALPVAIGIGVGGAIALFARGTAAA
jgi:hypothetical protein